MKKFSMLFAISISLIICSCLEYPPMEVFEKEKQPVVRFIDKKFKNTLTKNIIKSSLITANSQIIKKQEIENLMNCKEERPKVNKTFLELKHKIDACKSKLIFDKTKLTSGNSGFSDIDISNLYKLLKVFFGRVGITFEHVTTVDNIYATLGYDLQILYKLKQILNNMNLGFYSINNSRDRSLAYDLLLYLNNITNFMQLILYSYLRDLKLAKIATKDKVITEIYYCIDDLILVREYLIEKMKGMINLVASNIGNVLEMLDVLERELYKNSEIINIMHFMKEHKHKIEKLTWTG